MAIIKAVADSIDFNKLNGTLNVSPYTPESILDDNFTPKWEVSPFDADKQIASYEIIKTDGSTQTVFFNKPSKVATKYSVIVGKCLTRKSGVFNGKDWVIEVGDIKPSLKPHGYTL